MKLYAIFSLSWLCLAASLCYVEAATSQLPSATRQLEFTDRTSPDSSDLTREEDKYGKADIELAPPLPSDRRQSPQLKDEANSHGASATDGGKPTHSVAEAKTYERLDYAESGATAKSDESKNPKIQTQESQQVSVVADRELDTAAGGKGYSKSKGHKGNFKKSSGGKGSKGFHKSGGYKGGKGGSFSKNGSKGHFDKGGKKGSGHHHKAGHFGSHKAGEKGSKGHKHGKKGHHNKGNKNKGFKNVYHKEEFGKSSKFYGDSDSKKYHGKHDHSDSFFKGNKGGKSGGGSFKGGKHHDGSGKKGFFAKGQFHDDKGGHKGSHGKSGHFGHKSSFGKGGSSSSKKGGGHGGGGGGHGKGHGGGGGYGHGGGHGGHGKGHGGGGGYGHGGGHGKGHGGHGGGHGGHGGGHGGHGGGHGGHGGGGYDH